MPILEVFDETRGRGECRSCHAPITWFELVNSGKRMPFDGDVVFVRTRTDDDRRLVGAIDTSVNKSHFATCPQASKWRRR